MEVISRKCKGQGKVIFFPCPLLIIIFLLYTYVSLTLDRTQFQLPKSSRVTKGTGTVVELVSLVAQFVRVPDTAFAHPHLCKVLLPVPDGTLTFLIALPPFQNHKINQYIFLQLYYSVFLLSHNHSHVLIHFLLLTCPSMLHLKLNLS